MLLNKSHTSFLISRTRRGSMLALCFVLLIAVQSAVAQKADSTTAEWVPKRLQEAIGCLVAAPFVQEYGLKPVKLKVGDWAWVRYHVGSIPGLSKTPGELYVAVYAADGTHGELLLAVPNKRGGFDAVRNGYYLTKHGSHWTADGGSGGYVVYDAIGRFAAHLAQQPRYHVQLVPGDSEQVARPPGLRSAGVRCLCSQKSRRPQFRRSALPATAASAK